MACGLRAGASDDEAELASIPAEGYVGVDAVTADSAWYRAMTSPRAGEESPSGWISSEGMVFFGDCKICRRRRHR